MNKLLRKCRVVTATFLILSATSLTLAQSMPPVLGDGSGRPNGSNVLWDSEADQFDGITNDSVASTEYYYNADVNRYVYRMEYFGGDNQSFGGGVRDDAGNVIDGPIADAGQFNLRYLIRFGTTTGSPEWSTGSGPNFELKFPDLNTGDTSDRIIMMQRPARFNGGPRDSYAGSVVMTLGQPGGTIQRNIPQAGGNPDNTWGECFSGSGIWHYLEIQISDDGSITYWWGPYDGTGTEYTQGSPNAQLTGTHSFDFDSFRGNDRYDFGYRNHAASSTAENRIDVHLIINNSFIGPD